MAREQSVADQKKKTHTHTAIAIVIITTTIDDLGIFRLIQAYIIHMFMYKGTCAHVNAYLFDN